MNYDLSLDHVLLWAAPERIWYAPLILLLGVAVIMWGYRYIQRTAVLAVVRHQRLMLARFASWRIVVRVLLFIGALIAVMIALMQPQWGRKEMEITQEGRDVLIALDISGSMQAQDVKPSRLSFVKLKIRKLLERLSFERVGLLLFSGNAFIQCPLTADYQTFLMFLDQVTTESISSGTTAISSAVTKAAELFNRSQNRKHKLLMLITDGEDFTSNAQQLAQLVSKEKITVFAWGVGTAQGAPIPLYDTRGVMIGNAKNKDGSIAMSVLNEQLLQDISHQIGGHYERVTQDDSDVVRIAQSLDAYEREQLEERRISHYEERYPLFLAVAWGCLILEWLL